MPATTNPHEAAARDKKIAALIRKVDEYAAYAGLGRSDSYAVADMLESWPGTRWAELCVSAGQRPASETTRAMVIERIRRRAS